MASQLDSHAKGAHTHTHDHGPGHGHSRSEGAGHGDGHGDDMWAGQDYLSKPGVQEVGIISAETVVYALKSVGFNEDDLNEMDVIEIGCGPGVVTKHLMEHFKTIHSIDTSPSMLRTFSQTHSSSTTTSDRLVHSLHSLSSSSYSTFSSGIPQQSPTSQDERRTIVPPRSQFDLAIANLVLHHVDDLDQFMQGVTGLLKSDAWVVFTEFGQEAFHKLTQTTSTKNGSVNAPDHFHATLTPAFLSDLLAKHGLVDVHTEYKGTLPVFGVDGYQPPCLIVRARKP